MRRWTSSAAALVGLAALATALGAFVSSARADPAPIAARVLWWRGDRVYAAALDSATVSPGTRLTLLDGRKQVATAEVSGVLDREIIAARLTSGSLDRVKKPERLRLLAEPPIVTVPPRLRIGYPSAARSVPLLACARVSLGDAWPRALYVVEDSTASRILLLRKVALPARAEPWPDTLVARFFDDAADEEIALERGEIDAGVFWPGEASGHIRDALQWNGGPAGVRTRGSIAIAAERDGAALDSVGRSANFRSDLAKLNRELFRNDLLPLDAGAPPRAAGTATGPGIEYRARGPDAARVERFLARFGGAAGSARGTITIFYSSDSLGTPDPPFTRRVFAVRCPVLAARGFRDTVAALGADALVNLIDCAPGGRP